MRVIFVGEDKREFGVILKAHESDREFEITLYGKIHKYGLDGDRIYRSGRFRLPTSHYKVGDPVPLDMLRTNTISDVTALDYAQVARNTVTRDLLAAFDTKFLSVQNIFMFTMIAIAAAALGLGYFINTKFETMTELHQPAEIATGIQPPDTGVESNNLRDQLN